MDNNILLYILLSIPAFILFRASFWRRRDYIQDYFRHFIVVFAFYILAFYVAIEKFQKESFEAVLIAIIAGLIADRVFFVGRSRHIPASERRKVIAEFELKTGKKYNPNKYDIDHKVPFSKGGNNKADNLRVIPKKENRRKGDKIWWWG